MNRTLYSCLFYLALPLVALRLWLRARKAPVLRAAARRLLDTLSHTLFSAWCTWRDAHPWIHDAALFGELRSSHGGQPWWTWPAAERDRDPETLAELCRVLGPATEERAVLAFLFDHQFVDGVGCIGGTHTKFPARSSSAR